MGSLSFFVMKHFFISIVCALICAVSFAQSSFNTNIMNGDIKMREHFYEMALTYYKNARSVAANGEETAIADRKIADCVRVIDELKEAQQVKATKSKILFSDQYLESGDVYVGSIESYDRSAVKDSDEAAPLSLYIMDVYNDHIRILSHEDSDTATELEDIPAGSIIKLTKETSKYRRYTSEDGSEDFIIYKNYSSNEFGRYHIALRKDGDRYLRLYSWAEIHQIMKESGMESGAKMIKEEGRSFETDSMNNGGADSPKLASREILPISFVDSWALNLDSNNKRLGDTRSEPLVASDVRWLTLRLKYTCPDDYDNHVRFDIRVETPSCKVMKINGKGVSKGFSTYEILETIPGGGIFSIALGSDEPGTFESGRYVIGLWHDDVQYYSLVIVLQ